MGGSKFKKVVSLVYFFQQSIKINPKLLKFLKILQVFSFEKPEVLLNQLTGAATIWNCRLPRMTNSPRSIQIVFNPS